VRESLEAIDCACDCVSTGRDAIAAVRAKPYELLVIDYSLPDMRADELVRMPGMPPFLIATGRGDESTAVRLMRAGARDYIIKDSGFLGELPLIVERVLREIDTETRLAEARISLESRLRENEAMLREIHHRVKNNLQIVSSLVQLQTPADADQRVLAILHDIQGRISAMSLIHETLYESENLAQVDFQAYLEALARNLQAALGPTDRAIAVSCGGLAVQLPIDRAVPLGLVANELISNALEHAFPGGWEGEARVEVLVGLSERGGTYLSIEDNGIGMPDRDYLAQQPEGQRDTGRLGLELVRVLVAQLEASLSLGLPAGGSGTLWRIELLQDAPAR